MLRAEDIYNSLLMDPKCKPQPEACGAATVTVGERELAVTWELRPNAVWRRGRLFLWCLACRRRCTRLYLPLKDSWMGCRRCWGLSYQSRALLNYHDTPWLRGSRAALFSTQRDWAYERTDENRAARRKASRARWAARKDILANER
jgi:hypothetical protein